MGINDSSTQFFLTNYPNVITASAADYDVFDTLYNSSILQAYTALNNATTFEQRTAAIADLMAAKATAMTDAGPFLQTLAAYGQAAFPFPQTSIETGSTPSLSSGLDYVARGINRLLAPAANFLPNSSGDIQTETWSDFVSALTTYTNETGNTTGTYQFGGPIYGAFYNQWAAALGLPLVDPFDGTSTITSPTELGDFSVLVNNANPALNVSSSVIDTTSVTTAQDSLNQLFANSFKAFLQFTMGKNPNPISTQATAALNENLNLAQVAAGQAQVPRALTMFLQAYLDFTSGTTTQNPGFGILPSAMLSNTSLALSDTQLKVTPSYANLETYQNVFYAFFPGGTQTQYQSMVSQFVNQTVGATGYFMPSQNFEQWFTFVANTNGVFIPDLAAQQTQHQQNIALNLAFSLLTSMIQTIQSAAIAQSGQLNFLVSMQQAYTTAMGYLPTLTSANSGGDFSCDTTRGTANQQISATITQLRTNRQQFTDQATQFQSNVSQSQDAATQQANIASAILQNLQTILASIFK